MTEHNRDKRTQEHDQHQLDARGLYCPEPVMLLHRKIRQMGPGETLELLATDPSTTRDVTKFCHFLGHELLDSTEDGESFRYLIRKSASA